MVYAKRKITGPGFVTTKYVYPNQQNATTLWYTSRDGWHTPECVHRIGWVLFFEKFSRKALVPGEVIEVELVIQDRQFDINRQLFWPDGLPPSEGLNGPPSNPGLHPYAIPEFFGDVMVVNGKSCHT